MIEFGALSCPDCDGDLRYYDSVRRKLKSKEGREDWINIRRVRCVNCGKVHRELPDNVQPYVQYEKDVIEGVLEHLITPETKGFEDYPCVQTMVRWVKRWKLVFISLPYVVQALRIVILYGLLAEKIPDFLA